MSDPFEMLPSLVDELADADDLFRPYAAPELIQITFALLAEARHDLRQRIEFNWDVLELKSKSDRRLREWYTYHSVLVYDLSGGIETLLMADSVRSTIPLLRVLLEYHARVLYGAKRRSEIVKAFKQITRRFRKMMKADLDTWVELQSKEDRQHRQRLLTSGSAQVSSSKINEMFRVSFGKRNGKATYDRFYGLWSIMVHGSEACVPDVYRNLFANQEPRAQLDWQTKRWDKLDTLGTTVTLLCDFLRTIEDISGRGNASTVILKKLIDAQRKHDPVHAAFLTRYEKQFNRKVARRKRTSGVRATS